MKLFVKDKQNPNRKIYISDEAYTRNQLRRIIGSPYFVLEGQYYNVNDVEAEAQLGDTAFGTIAGGILGAFTGGTGILLGLLGGALMGNYRDTEEQKKVDIFNSSYVKTI